jgi:CzcA family heavy metal efflux pump
LPDLSDTQVIIRAQYPGKAPQIVEDQVTYPLTTALLAVPGAKTVRGYSFFGDSFVYVLFDDATDLYWARSRVLEYISQAQSRLPQGVRAELGPDGTGVGWVFEYALVDRTGNHDLSQLRALNDWFLRFELKTVPDVAEVASIGGMVKQYQVVLDPDKLRAFGISHAKVLDALAKANQESGGSVVEMAESEYMVRSHGYLHTLEDFRNVLLSANEAGTPVLLRDVATVRLGPEMRRGIAELNGEGEVAGGVVVMRSGKNALETIKAVKTRLATLQGSLPKGVEIVPTYDRSKLITAAVTNLRDKLIEEFIVVAIVCAIFLFHLRSAFVAIVSLPLGVLAAFIVMRYQGVNANIMSLGGIAIAIGAMVDAAIVMIENAHKHLEAWAHAHPAKKLAGKERWELITLRLGDIADIKVTDGPPMIRSENARLSGWVYVDVRGTDLRSAVKAMQAAVQKEVKLPGYSIGWSGQFEYLERAAAKLQTVIPLTLAVIFILLYLAFRSASEALLLMLTVPFALIGGFWFVWMLGHAVSVATAVGFIALAGLAAEFGVVMLVYLRNSLNQRLATAPDVRLPVASPI